MAVAKKLYAAYPSEDFWEKVFLSFKINTLRWFLTSDGKNFLRTEQRKQSLDFETKTNYTLGNKKVGKDKKVTRKIRTIKEFLKQDA